MRRSATGRWMILLAVLAVALWAGCQDKSATDQTPRPGVSAQKQAAPPQQAPDQKGPAVETQPAEEPPPPPTIPEVHLLDVDRATCLVGVDDPMPEGELAGLDGKNQPLGALKGEKLTVVFFWTKGDSEFASLRAQTALEDLQKDVQESYAEKGVRVVAVNEGDGPEAVKKLAEAAGATYPVLLDPDGALFAKVATERLPRPYLLDGDGKILWFDLEFSRTSRAKLLQAIQVALGETGSEAPP
jgi:peroxiredoxin